MSAAPDDGSTAITFLHVGKCAGSTVESVLRQLTRPEDGGRCIHMAERPVHMHRPQWQRNESELLMTTRDPVDRIVSAFNFRHPTRGYPHIHDKAIPGKPGADPTEIELYQCFTHANEFAEALDGTDHCADVARSVFHCCDHMPRYIFIGQGYEYYIGAPGIDAFERRRYALTHVDDLHADLVRISQWLGCTPPPAALEHIRSDYPSKHDTDLSSRGRANLLAMLQHEYELHARINAHAAVNARNVTQPAPATFAAAAAAIAAASNATVLAPRTLLPLPAAAADTARDAASACCSLLGTVAAVITVGACTFAPIMLAFRLCPWHKLWRLCRGWRGVHLFDGELDEESPRTEELDITERIM